MLVITHELIEQYLQDKEDHYSEDYQKNTRTTLEILVRYIPKDKELTPNLASRSFKQNFADNPRNKDKELSNASLKNYLKRVSLFLKWFVGKRHPVRLSFMDYIEDIDVTKHDPKIIDSNDLRSFIEKLPIYYEFFFFVAVNVGARRTALTELNRENISFVKIKNLEEQFEKDAYDKLVKNFSPETEMTLIKRLDKYKGKKARKEIEVFLQPKETKQLKHYLKTREKKEEYFIKKKKFSFEDKKGKYLFWNKRGKRMNPESVSSYLTKMKKLTGIDITSHDGRRRFIQALWNRGIRKEDIMEMSGHETEEAINRYFKANRKQAWSEVIRKS